MSGTPVYFFHHNLRRDGNRLLRGQYNASVWTPPWRLAFLLLISLSLYAQNNLVSWKDLKIGQKGVGRTVFTGSTVSDFEVEVLGVLENAGPKQALILAHLRGGPLEKTGVMQGMSGSPVYFNGRLAGAVAFAFPFAKEAIAGIRPIGEMIAAADPVPGANTLRASVPFGDRRLEEIATPISFLGFTPGTLAQFGDELRRLGLEPRQGVSGGGALASAMGDPKRLQPGSMISVQLMTGDMAVGADGTVTHIDGNRLYAFGHRFLAAGDMELPFARAEVVTLLPTITTSFKISNAREWMGAITSDRNAAVAGVLGRRARMVPVSVRLESDANGRPRLETYKMEMAEHRTLAPFLTQMAVFSVLDATERSLGSSTIAIDGQVRLAGGLPPLTIRNRFAGDFATGLPAAMAMASPLAALMEAGLPGLRVEAIDVKLKVENRKRALRIDQAWLSRKEARAGDEVELHLSLSGDDGVEERRSVKYRLPSGLEAGTVNFTVADGPSANLWEARQLYSGGSLAGKTAAEFIEGLNRLKGNTGAYVRVWVGDTAFPVGARELGNLPRSAAMVLGRSALAANTSWVGTGSKVGEIELDFGEVVVSGSRSLTLTIQP